LGFTSGIGNLRVAEATPGRIDTFLRAVAKKTPTLARHCRTVLSSAMSLAVRHDAIGVNPVRETGTVMRKKIEVRALTVEQLNDLRAKVDRWQQGLDKNTGQPQRITHPRANDLLDVTDILAATGARIGEVLALRWTDINHDDDGKATVTISGTVTWINGQGLVRQDHPKTASGWRTITLPPFAANLLRAYHQERQPTPDDPVFPSGSGTFRSPNNFRRAWRDAITGTGYEWVTPHTFRRTVATLLDRERSTDDAAAQLGHSDTAVTRTHYIAKAHRAPDVSDVLQQLQRPPVPPAMSL
jgi:integrase